MTATILQFPKRDTSEQLAQVGELMKTAVPVPHTADPELDMLLQIGGKLLDNLTDFQAVDCWIVRLEQWEVKNGG